MKTFRYIFLFLAGFLAFSSCDSNSYNGGTYKEQVNSHNYEANNTRDDDEYGNEKEGSGQRRFWQKPHLVINKLGPLEGKVIADIGAGPNGYFTTIIANNTNVEKVIAIDIDKDAIQFIENQKIIQPEKARKRIETRLVEPDDPKLKDGEADIILVVNTYMYLKPPVTYFKNLRKGIAEGGKLYIIDFKKRNTPEGPPVGMRTAVGEVERDLIEAGYVITEVDDQTLVDNQYIIVAQPGLEN